MSPSPNRQPFNILPLANASNPLHHCMFKHESSTNNTDGTEPPSVRWAMTQMSAADPSGEPRTYVLKAEPEGEVTAVGFAIVKVFEREGDEEKEESTWQEEGNTNDPEATERCKEPPGHETKSDLEVNDDTLEPAFCGVYLGKLNDVYERHMAGKRHAYISTLMILPSHQRRGIGSAIIRYTLNHLNLKQLPIWIYAQPDGYDLYKKFGWRDVENVDMKLDEWKGKGKGYGAHRTVCMLREPDRVEEEKEEG